MRFLFGLPNGTEASIHTIFGRASWTTHYFIPRENMEHAINYHVYSNRWMAFARLTNHNRVIGRILSHVFLFLCWSRVETFSSVTDEWWVMIISKVWPNSSKVFSQSIKCWWSPNDMYFNIRVNCWRNTYDILCYGNFLGLLFFFV